MGDLCKNDYELIQKAKNCLFGKTLSHIADDIKNEGLSQYVGFNVPIKLDCLWSDNIEFDFFLNPQIKENENVLRLIQQLIEHSFGEYNDTENSFEQSVEVC